jgi:hypothetical protein
MRLRRSLMSLGPISGLLKDIFMPGKGALVVLAMCWLRPMRSRSALTFVWPLGVAHLMTPTPSARLVPVLVSYLLKVKSSMRRLWWSQDCTVLAYIASESGVLTRMMNSDSELKGVRSSLQRYAWTNQFLPSACQRC